VPKYVLLLCDGTPFDPVAYPTLAGLMSTNTAVPYLHRVADEPATAIPTVVAATKQGDAGGRSTVYAAGHGTMTQWEQLPTNIEDALVYLLDHNHNCSVTGHHTLTSHVEVGLEHLTVPGVGHTSYLLSGDTNYVKSWRNHMGSPAASWPIPIYGQQLDSYASFFYVVASVNPNPPF